MLVARAGCQQVVDLRAVVSETESKTRWTRRQCLPLGPGNSCTPLGRVFLLLLRSHCANPRTRAPVKTTVTSKEGIVKVDSWLSKHGAQCLACKLLVLSRAIEKSFNGVPGGSYISLLNTMRGWLIVMRHPMLVGSLVKKLALRPPYAREKLEFLG